MVVLRLKRMGRTHAPFYRICAMDRRCPPDGRSPVSYTHLTLPTTRLV